MILFRSNQNLILLEEFFSFLDSNTISINVDLTLKFLEDAENTTLSTELKPPPYPQKEGEHYLLFVINLFGLKNISGETSDEVLENDLLQHVPDLTGS